MKIQKKKIFIFYFIFILFYFFFGGGVGSGGRVGGGGFRVDVNAMFGVGGDVGYGGCEPRREGIVQCTKRYCTILRKLKNVGGRGRGNI